MIKLEEISTTISTATAITSATVTVTATTTNSTSTTRFGIMKFCCFQLPEDGTTLL
jgi:hypothetical protein